MKRVLIAVISALLCAAAAWQGQRLAGGELSISGIILYFVPAFFTALASRSVADACKFGAAIVVGMALLAWFIQSTAVLEHGVVPIVAFALLAMIAARIMAALVLRMLVSAKAQTGSATTDVRALTPLAPATGGKAKRLLLAAVALAGIGVAGTAWFAADQGYSKFDLRVAVNDGAVAAAPAREAVAVFWSAHNMLPASNAQAQAASPLALAADFEKVSEVLIAGGGVITIYFASSLQGDFARLANHTLVYTPAIRDDGGLEWDCRGGTLPRELRPGHCQPER